MMREKQGTTLRAARHDNKCNKATSNKATMVSNKVKPQSKNNNAKRKNKKQ
jgi:hypothetical protein